MFQVTAMDVKNDRRILATRLYMEFQNALSDVVNGESDLHCYLDDLGKAVDADRPEMIYTGGTKPNGYDDDFHFRYPNGIVICIGEAIIQDEEGRIR